MRDKIVMVTLFTFLFLLKIQAQKVIPLYAGKAPGSETWTWQEQEIYSTTYRPQTIVYNVSQPTLTAYLPPASTATGTAVIIAPGGAFHTLAINNEGIDVAKWLNAKGVAAFVLRYRLVKSETDDPVQEVIPLIRNRKKMDSVNAPVIPLAIADGLTAITYLRTHAMEYEISPDRIGFMGFSAGGAVTAGVIFNYTAESRPDFAAPIYGYTGAFIKSGVPKDAPPVFVAAASDDELGLAPQSTKLYADWIAAGKSAELHLYTKGGHGFGMHKAGIPTDTWIDRFGDWLDLQGLLWPAQPKGLYAMFTPQQVKQMRKDEEDRLHSDWAYLTRYREENKNLSAPRKGEKRVVFMGSSRIENWKKLDSSLFIDNGYINRGVSGQTSSQMLVRFRQDVIDLKPAVVVFMGGSNDIAGNTGPVSMESIFGNIVSMAELAKANGIQMVLCSELPVYDYPWRTGLEPAEKIVALNRLLKAYALKNNITYADLFPALADERKGMKKALTTDGVHPNLAGYKLIEPLVQQSIARALQ